jgi:hypothetical protein
MKEVYVILDRNDKILKIFEKEIHAQDFAKEYNKKRNTNMRLRIKRYPIVEHLWKEDPNNVYGKTIYEYVQENFDYKEIKNNGCVNQLLNTEFETCEMDPLAYCSECWMRPMRKEYIPVEKRNKSSEIA